MKRVQKFGKDIGSTLRIILGFIVMLTISCLDILSFTYVPWNLAVVLIGHPSLTQSDIRLTLIAVLYIVIRILGELIKKIR